MRHNLHFSLRPSLDEKYPPASFGRLDVRTVFSLLLRALSFIPKDRDYRPNRPNRPKPSETIRNRRRDVQKTVRPRRDIAGKLSELPRRTVPLYGLFLLQ